MKIALWSIPLLALLLLPLWLHSPYPLHIFILLFIAIAMGESWNVLGGFAGQYSVGHAAFYGLGAYGISSYGKYHFDASVTYGGTTKTASADADVTSTPGKDTRCPAP